MNIPRAKGTMAESGVVGYLRANGFPTAERRSLKGSLDQGDVTGTPGLAWEVKYANSGIRLTSWMASTEVERLNAGADFGILVVKPRLLGVKAVHRWVAMMHAGAHHEIVRMTPEYEVLGPRAVHVGRPFTYTASKLMVNLAAIRRSSDSTLAPEVLTAVTTIPRLVTDERFYVRAMYLQDMVTLLRQAGFGQ